VAQDSQDMRAELAAWKAESVSRAEILDRERRETNEVLAPLRLSLSEAEERVREQLRKVLAARVSVAQNDQRIADLVRMAAQRRQ
jgi:Microtubule-binding protein MIP-T3 C-terminal region